MNPNTQTNNEQSTQNTEQAVNVEQPTVQEQSVNVEQPVVQEQPANLPVQQEVTQQPAQQNISAFRKQFLKKKKLNPIILILIVVVIVAGFFFLNKSKKPGGNVLGGENGNQIVKIDTGKSWGDSFAVYIQKFSNELEVEKAKLKEDGKKVVEEREYEVTFIDFDFDGTPEMIVKYIDFSGAETYRIMRFANGEVSESKDFRNCSFRLIYSIKEKNVKWYIYITNNNKYGAYTQLEKIIKGKAFDSDIKASNDKEVANYNNNYASTNYKYIFYKLEAKTFVDDFKLAVDKFDSNDKDIQEAKNKLMNDYGNAQVEEEEINTDPNIVIGEFTLEFGNYVSKVDVYENGKVVGTEDLIISINRNWTITDGDKVIKYNIYGNTFSLENGTTIRVIENNKFMYGVGEGFEYNYVK